MNKTKNIINWILGLLLCTLGLSFSTKADLGLSMIGASPYILHVYMRDKFSWFSQGCSEYVWEAILLVITVIIVRRFKAKYLLSFMTAVLAGFAIDGWLFILGGNSAYESMTVRILTFVLGTLITALAIAFFFRTSLPLQVYELAVTEIADRYKFDKDKVKYINDIIMLVIALALSFILTHKLTGIGVGTVIITFVNAPLIKIFGKLIDRIEKL